MSLPKALEAKVVQEESPYATYDVVPVSDLEAFFDGELTQCPECGGRGSLYAQVTRGQTAPARPRRSESITETRIPCPANCDQGQVRGPGLAARVAERAARIRDESVPRAIRDIHPLAFYVMEALVAELSQSPTSEPDREGT